MLMEIDIGKPTSIDKKELIFYHYFAYRAPNTR